MNLIRTNTSFSPGHSSPEFYYQRSVDSKNQLDIDKKILRVNFNSKSYINAESIGNKFRVSTIFNHNINSAIGLVQSIVSAAVIIENKLEDIRVLANKNEGDTAQAIKEIEESVIDIAKNFSWNGINYMAGKEGNNQNSVPRKLSIKKELETTRGLQMSFKSFNPISAVSAKQSLESATWNQFNISKRDDLDTHAYGSAVLYSNAKSSSNLDTHTRATRDQTIIQVSKAIDGITLEKSRLEDYLRKLNDIHETNQSESLNKSNYINQSIDAEQAYQIATFLENEMLKNSNKDIFPREKISIFKLNELLH